MIQYFDQLSQMLFNARQFNDAGDLLMISLKYCQNQEQAQLVLSNARMSYFQGNNVPKAFGCLEMLEAMGDTSWELQRDKANYLRYLERHDEAWDIVQNKLPDNGTKFLAMGWFIHKEGRIREAFEVTERARHDNYWWGSKGQLPYPIWDGKTYVEHLIIGAESGHGDELIFARWIPEAKKYCKNIYYYTNNSLSEVFYRIFGIEKFDPNMDLNYQVAPMMSLPYFFGVDEPGPLKYLTADPVRVESYNKRFPKTGPRIGLCFHGEVTHIETNLRTLPRDYTVDLFKDIGEVVNLQREYESINPNLKYYPFDTWEDTLALLDTCDLIITCDTSVSHAAAALGKTTIVLMHAAAYFTWNHNGYITRSNWYENGWCVKQTEPCVWEGTLERAKELAIQLLNGEKPNER